MDFEYLYGAYGHIDSTVVQSAEQAGTVPVYIGTAPVNLVRGYKEGGVVNRPVRISNMPDAQRKIGHSADWASFTLSEVVDTHFNSPQGNIGPIIVINTLDPDVHVKATGTTRSLVFTNGRSEFASETIVLDTLLLADKVEGVDFNITYSFERSVVVISSADQADPLTGTIVATYKEVDTAQVTEAEIIGKATLEGEYGGIGAVSLVYPDLNAITNLIAAPGWSHIPEVYKALVTAAQKINGHWFAMAVADIPILDGAVAVDTIAKATTWKAANGYDSEFSKVCWPMKIDKSGQVHHLSVDVVAAFMRVDGTHGGVPMETCGNKEVSAERQYFGEIATNHGFDQQTGNLLAQEGITTLVKWGGKFVLWGDHTAAYSFGGTADPRVVFDVSMRMLMHIANDFQREWSPEVDKPMTRALKDRILNREQEKLDGHVSRGALLGNPRIEFVETENPTEQLIEGHFRWDTGATPTPPAKALDLHVAYTTEGFESFFEGGE